jgi:hypothetical protein
LKTKLLYFICLLSAGSGLTARAQKTYVIIPKSTSEVNTQVVGQLSPNLKGLAAYYSAIGGTNCKDQTCELTSALGLGSQGSVLQKNLIQKYFPDDNVVNMICGQDCYLPPANTLSYSNFKFLSFTVQGETIKVDYQLAVYDRGNLKLINGPDIYTYQNQTFKDKKRVLYGWVKK